MAEPGFDVHDDLRRAMSNRDARPMIVAGAGVSLAATGTGGWTWTGLVRHAIDYAEKRRDIEGPQAEELRKRLAASVDAESTVAVASDIADALIQQGHFAGWLATSVGQLTIGDERLIVALRKLATTFNAVLATTNYDDLLSQDGGPPPAPWTNADHVLRVMRGEVQGVAHLHGVHTTAESVIFGHDDYGRVLSDRRAQFLEQLAGIGHTLVFVGCGAGLEDHNVGALLTWLEEWRTPHSHYRLCRDDDVQRPRAVINVPFGPSDDHLVPYLTELIRSGPIPPRQPPVRSRLLVEVDHGDDVLAVAMDPQGTRLVTGGCDRMVRIWPMPASPANSDGRPLTVEEPEWSRPEQGAVYHAAFSPDGTLLATGSDSGARLRLIEDAPALGTAPHAARVTALAFDKPGERLATAGQDGDVNVWAIAEIKDAATKPSPVTFTHRSFHPVDDVAFSSDGRWLATADSDGTVAIRSFGRSMVLWSVAGAARRVSTDLRGKRLATGDKNGFGRVYITEALTSQDDQGFATLEEEVRINTLLARMNDSPRGPNDDLLRPWCIVDHRAPITALCVSADGRTLVTAGEDGSVAC